MIHKVKSVFCVTPVKHKDVVNNNNTTGTENTDIPHKEKKKSTFQIMLELEMLKLEKKHLTQPEIDKFIE
jgi:hypothetical protein